MKRIACIALVILSMALCAIGGYMYAVHSATLLEVTTDGYEIAYGESVHSYTF